MNTNIDATRNSIIARNQCASVFPSPHMFTVWTVPTRWDPTVFMYSSTTALCTRALIKKMKQLHLTPHCTVSPNIDFDLIEIRPKRPGGMIYRIEEFEWLDELDAVVNLYKDQIMEEELKVVVPVGIDFHDLDGSEARHHFICILSKYQEFILFEICDGNGFQKSWHKPFMMNVDRFYSESSPRVVAFFDKSQPSVNFIETDTVRGHLAKLGIRYPKRDGQCAFLAYIYTLDQLCTGISRDGHGLRLFQDLLLRDDNIERMTPWELAVVSAYVMATAYRVLQIMIEFYPNKDVAVANGWYPELDYPDLDAIRSIQISKRIDRNVLKLAKV